MEGSFDKRIIHTAAADYIDDDGYSIFKLANALTNIRSIELLSFEGANNFNNIDANLKNNTIISSGTIVTIPDGIYNATQLAQALHDEILAATAEDITVTFSIDTGKFTFQNNTAPLLLSINPNPNTILYSGYLYGIDPSIPLSGALGTPVEAPFPMDLQSNKEVIIDIGPVNQGVYSSFNMLGQYNVPINVNSFNIIRYTKLENFYNILFFNEGCIYIKMLKLRLLNQYGQPLNTNNCNFTINLIINKYY